MRKCQWLCTVCAGSVDRALVREEHPVTQHPPEELTEYSLTALLTPAAAPAEPADFAEFWRGTYEKFGIGPVSWSPARRLDATDTHQVTEIRFQSSADEQAVAFLEVS